MIETIGKIVNLYKDFRTGKYNLVLELENEAIIDSFNDLSAIGRLAIKLAKYCQKRSLDANAYAWVLMTKIANKKHISKEEVYEDMLKHYGFPDADNDGNPIAVTISVKIDISNLGGHWFYYKGNGKFNSYIKIKGSSEYTTSEMSHFIEGIVYEAKELGIDTMIPEDIERLVSQWTINN